MVTCTINIPQMLAYIPYMDPMGNKKLGIFHTQLWYFIWLFATLIYRGKNPQVASGEVHSFWFG